MENRDSGRGRDIKMRQTAEIQKARIIRSFYETILEHGFEGASMAKVAGRIDVHTTLILHYFGNKENMTLALVDFVIDAYAEIFDKLRRQRKYKDPSERLLAFCRTIWSRPYYEKIDISATLSVVSASFRNKRMKNKIKFLYQEYKRLLVYELEALSETGIIETGDYDRKASVIISMAEGARHFHPFITRAKDLNQYNADMVATAMTLLKKRFPDNGNS